MRIGILTSFTSMLDFYSLTSVVKTQIKLIHHAGHTPILLTCEGFEWAEKPEWLEVRQAIKGHTKTDYASTVQVSQSDLELIPHIAEGLKPHLVDLDAILAHDLLFTGWHLLINRAIHLISRSVRAPWLHWVHSVASARRDYWVLPQNSWLVFPNWTDRIRCAESFQVLPERVLVVPHCADLRDIHQMDPVAEELISRYDLLGADLVQVYPIPTDRAATKGVNEVIQLFSCFKRQGKSVRLVFPNAWCNVPERRNEVQEYMRRALAQGLSRDEVIFTSVACPEHELGLNLKVIGDLALCGNVFACPTMSETFGFSLAEAALHGCFLILNENLPMMKETIGGYGNATWAKWKSNFFTTQYDNPDQYFMDIAKIAMSQMEDSQAFKSTNYYRKTYRREAVWKRLEGVILQITNKQTLQGSTAGGK